MESTEDTQTKKWTHVYIIDKSALTTDGKPIEFWTQDYEIFIDGKKIEVQTLMELPNNFKFNTKHSDIVYSAVDVGETVDVTWMSPSSGKTECSNYPKDGVIDYITKGYWNIIKDIYLPEVFDFTTNDKTYRAIVKEDKVIVSWTNVWKHCGETDYTVDQVKKFIERGDWKITVIHATAVKYTGNGSTEESEQDVLVDIREKINSAKGRLEVTITNSFEYVVGFIGNARYGPNTIKVKSTGDLLKVLDAFLVLDSFANED